MRTEIRIVGETKKRCGEVVKLYFFGFFFFFDAKLRDAAKLSSGNFIGHETAELPTLKNDG